MTEQEWEIARLREQLQCVTDALLDLREQIEQEEDIRKEQAKYKNECGCRIPLKAVE